ncbi:hypothetical protein GCM10011374_39780 [Kocuria dechangensis]|uniref:Uncharacterized protein n=1 Tax=Kocuria dechangensis TaxID=1176249 RepID=A0A917M161_9MICC|nr:hypothetical protein [Kocuria dechangensis]GGG71161.1 hypothetical protein GCM10011374_39780 [Kocuria dechangensis]
MNNFRLSWQRLDPLQKGLLVGLVIGVLIAALTRQLLWGAALVGCGAVVGWFFGKARLRPEEREHAARLDQPLSPSGYQDGEDENEDEVTFQRPAVAHSTVEPPPSTGHAADRELEVVTRARDENLPNAAFTLTLFNRRHTGPSHPGQEPVDVHAALGDLHDAESIDDAILRAEELLAHAQDLGFGARNARNDRAELQLSHPGFSPEHLAEALNWGYRSGR